jgi:hypothetical protein
MPLCVGLSIGQESLQWLCLLEDRRYRPDRKKGIEFAKRLLLPGGGVDMREQPEALPIAVAPESLDQVRETKTASLGTGDLGWAVALILECLERVIDELERVVTCGNGCSQLEEWNGGGLCRGSLTLWINCCCCFGFLLWWLLVVPTPPGLGRQSYRGYSDKGRWWEH